MIDHARKLSTQACDPAPHYQHSEIGYVYRMSNHLAAVGCGQMQVLADRVAANRRIFDTYAQAVGDLPGITLMPEASWGRCTRWRTCITVDPLAFGAHREAIRLALEAENIESPPLWKPKPGIRRQGSAVRGCHISGFWDAGLAARGAGQDVGLFMDELPPRRSPGDGVAGQAASAFEVKG